MFHTTSARLLAMALLICASLVRAQNSSFPDLTDFKKSTAEHIIDTVDEPFRVSLVKGRVSLQSSGSAVAGVLFEIEGPEDKRRIQSTVTDKNGRFKISHIAEGIYKFKATLNGYQSVIGTVVVLKHAPHATRIRIEMRVGV
jgi:hypothetical protein